MAEKIVFQSPTFPTQEENQQLDDEELMIQTLPLEKTWDGAHLQLYQGFWYPVRAPPKAIISFQNNFKARNTDIFLLTLPKSGTTWMKALIYSIVSRDKITPAQSPLLTSSPHDLVPFLEFDIYLKNPTFDLEKYGKISDPRILATHVSCSSLPKSILDSNCRIIYLCRNPLDQFISYWHFFIQFTHMYDDDNAESKMGSIEEGFNQFCRGIHAFGPFIDHVLCHWKLSLEKPENVLFMKYEDLKKDTGSCLIKIAEFLGCPFSNEEMEKGVVGEIENLCSFETLKNLDVNKKGRRPSGVKHETFFRKGQVGDWKNYITPSMADRMKKLLEDKLGDSGLKFDM